MKRVESKKVSIMRKEKRHQNTWRPTLKKYIFLQNISTPITTEIREIHINSHNNEVNPLVNKAINPL